MLDTELVEHDAGRFETLLMKAQLTGAVLCLGSTEHRAAFLCHGADAFVSSRAGLSELVAQATRLLDAAKSPLLADSGLRRPARTVLVAPPGGDGRSPAALLALVGGNLSELLHRLAPGDRDGPAADGVSGLGRGLDLAEVSARVLVRLDERGELAAHDSDAQQFDVGITVTPTAWSNDVRVALALPDVLVRGSVHRRFAEWLAGGAPLRRQAGGLGLDADAQLEHRDHVAQRGHLLRREPEAGCRLHRTDDEAADAVPRVDQARGLQLGDRLAHHGAADAELLHHRGLGRHLVARRQASVVDALAERVDELERQRARAPGGNRLSGCRHSVETPSRPH